MRVKSFTKNDLCELISARHGGYSIKEIHSIVETILDAMNQGVKQDSKLMISGFGTFFKKDVKKRTVILPSGEKLQSRDRKRLWFKPSQGMKDRVNQAFDDSSGLEGNDD